MKLNHCVLSIKSKITLIFILFSLLMLFLLWIFQTFFLESFYKSIKIHNTRNSALAVANNIDQENLDTLIEKLQYEENVNIQVFNSSGQELQPLKYSSHPFLSLPLESLKHLLEELDDSGENILIEALPIKFRPERPYKSDGFVGNVPPNNQEQVETIVCITQTFNAAGEAIVILSCAPLPLIRAVNETLQMQWVCIALIMLLLCLLLAHFLSRQIAEPIVQMNESARQLAKGNYDEHFSSSSFREISELSAALNFTASELGKVEQLRRELFANVSHDLRTPLTMIKGYGEMMRDIPGENTPENIQIIIDETTRLSLLVTDMLDLSRLQAGTQEFINEPFNLTQSIRDILSRYAKFIEQEHYDIVFQYDEELYVEANELKISQVIYNLINNGINYTGADKKVIVQQIRQNSQVKISITDTGNGISESQKPYVWQRYFRLAQTQHHEVIGTGLGLSIVRSILEIYHAEYGIDSREGEGSTFWFILPCIRS